jgi:hypothetical protein
MNATYGESVMAGKKGRSGRPLGALSWYQNPTARCGHALNAAVELWLALVPERRFTMPPKIRRFTAQNVIRQTLCNEIESSEVAVVDVDDVLAWSRRHNTAAKVEGGPTLRRKVRRSRDDDSPAETDGAIVASAVTTFPN